MAQAVSVTSVMNGIGVAAETAIRLMDAVLSIQTRDNNSSTPVQISTAVELVEWHRIEKGEYKGQQHYLARFYYYDNETGVQRFVTREMENGKIKINRNPFSTLPLEIRNFKCSQPISSDPALKTVNIDAGFTMRARITKIDAPQMNGVIPSQYPCTLYFDETALPAGCDDPGFLPHERRLSVTLRLAGPTYFVPRQSGANYSYGSIPGIVLGTRNPETEVIPVADPNKSNRSKIKE